LRRIRYHRATPANSAPGLGSRFGSKTPNVRIRDRLAKADPGNAEDFFLNLAAKGKESWNAWLFALADYHIA
jgi:hypothetical protein